MLGRGSKSLFWRAGSILLLIELTLGITFALVGGSMVEEAAVSRTERRLENLVKLMVREVDRGVDPDRLLAPGDIRLTVITEDGRVRSDNRRVIEPADQDLNYRPEVESALRSGSGFAVRYSMQLDRVMMFAAATTADSAGDRLVIRVAIDMDAVQNTAGRLAVVILILMVLVMVATVAVIWWMRSRLVTDLRSVDDLVRRLGDCDPIRGSTRNLSQRVCGELARIVTRLGRTGHTIQIRMEALEQAQSETQGILTSMSNGVIALDTTRRILTMNPAAVRMFSLLGRNIRGRLLEEVVRDPSLLAAIADGVEEGRMIFRELELESLGGRTVEVGVEPLYGGATLAMTGILVILNDTTKLRRLERIRKDFAANVSHELRTPLTAIQGYVELLGDSVSDQTGRDRLAGIERNAVRLNSIIEDLLTLSRIESDEESSMPLQLEPVIVEDLLRSAATLCRPAATAAGIEIRVEAEDGLMVLGNRPLLDQAIINLLENAIRYSEERTTITLRSGADAMGDIRMAVEDQGCGIAAEHLPRLFERFYRVDSGRSRDLGGTGLGLSIVKHIALIHGGRVDLESSVGVGSTFFLTLPTRRPSDPDTDPDSSPSADLTPS